MKKVAILVLGLVLVFSAPLLAGSIDENANSTNYLTKFPAMLVRGTVNIVTSPAEIVIHTYKGTREGIPVIGTFEGLITGLGWTLDRAGRGVLDIVGSFVPNYHGAPPTHVIEFSKSTE